MVDRAPLIWERKRGVGQVKTSLCAVEIVTDTHVRRLPRRKSKNKEVPIKVPIKR